MKTQTFHLELITPCFCGGALPEEQAEIRTPSIRGQLRWWFRTLGGFKSLEPKSVPEQEAMIFGSTAGDSGQAGKLILRVKNQPPPSTQVKDARQFNQSVGQEAAYITFPLRTQGRALHDWNTNASGARSLPTFDLQTLWRGDSDMFEDLRALVIVYANFGSLGFRNRRALGALSLQNPPYGLEKALKHFTRSQQLIDGIKEIRQHPQTGEPANHRNANDCIVSLAQWLKDWRAHGRTTDHSRARAPHPPYNSGFRPYAENDHNRGVDVGMRRGSPSDVTYRPALGLPIIQFFSSPGRPQIDWTESWDAAKARQNPNYKGEGRFASPVLLRPYLDSGRSWHALVIFVDAHKWPEGKPVYLKGYPREVSLDLYEAMKNDSRLKRFL